MSLIHNFFKLDISFQKPVARPAIKATPKAVVSVVVARIFSKGNAIFHNTVHVSDTQELLSDAMSMHEHSKGGVIHGFAL